MNSNKLLEVLKKNGIESKEEIEKILSYDEKVLEVLLGSGRNFISILDVIKCYSNKEDIFEAIAILEKSKENNLGIYITVYNILTNKYAIQSGTSLSGARIILGAENIFQAKYAFAVLTDEDAIESKIALSGAELIISANNDYQAKYAYYVLTDKEVISSGDALEIAKEIMTYEESSLKNYDKNSIIHFIKDVMNVDISPNPKEYSRSSNDENTRGLVRKLTTNISRTPNNK